MQISSLKLSWDVWGPTHSDDFLELTTQIHVDASGSSFALLFLRIDSENTSEAALQAESVKVYRSKKLFRSIESNSHTDVE